MESPSLNNSAQDATRKIYSISELTRDIKRLLEERYPLIWVSGELSNLRIPTSGHAYFSLKDENAQISVVLFRGQLRQLRFEIEDGMTLLALGRISVYEPRGSYQIILEYAEPKGVGALQLAFEQLKQKLSAEGLFDERLKQSLPFLPSRVGVITSPGGAVIQDILNVIGRRFHSLAVDLYPVRVQGDAAAAEIVQAIGLANQRSVNDVIILARGGGSLEDLAPFNSEVLARAIAGSVIPIVSAVGHETDFTIADFVADLRAPTPSAAAELAVPVKNELKARCIESKQRCLRAAGQHVAHMRSKADLLTRTLVHPGKKMADARINLDYLVDQLWRHLQDILQRRKMNFGNVQMTLANNNPLASILQYRPLLKILRFKLQQSMHSIYGTHSERLKTADALIKALNPEAILQRGYSITRTLPGRKVATNAASIKHGQLLEIQLASGSLEALAQKRNHDRQED